MSYHEKRTITEIVSALLILGAYSTHVFGKYQAGLLGDGDFKAWAGIMLVFFGISVVLTIAIEIVFHILMSIGIAVKEAVSSGGEPKNIDKAISSTFIEDEMDKLIGLKASKFGPYITGIGFIMALVSLVLGSAPALMLNIIFVSWYLGSAVEGIVRIYYYRRGVQHG